LIGEYRFKVTVQGFMVQSSKVRKRRKTKLLDEEEKMRASMSKKLLLAGNASSETEPVYAGWTVGDSWDDGFGTSYGTILRSTDSGETRRMQ
jgi:hypothetical protein